MKKLIVMALVCLGFAGQVLAGCGCGAARANLNRTPNTVGTKK